MLNRLKPFILAALAVALLASPSRAQNLFLNNLPVKLCDATVAARCATVNADGTISISGTFSATLAGFNPTATATAALSVTTTSADVALPAGADDVVENVGATDAYFRVTVGAGTAVTTDMLISAGQKIGIHAATATHLSAITASSTTSFIIQGGTGLFTGVGGSSSGGGTATSTSTLQTSVGATNHTDLGTINTTLGTPMQATGGSVTANAGTNLNTSALATSALQTSVGATAHTDTTAITTALGTPMQTSGGSVTANAGTNLNTSALATSALQTSIGSTAHTDATSSIPAGGAIIGQTGIDQTTDGTTNAVHLKAGTALAGKFGIDQTTPGTTNAVQAISGTTGGMTPYTLTAAASTNATNIKASAGTLYHIAVYNNSATLAWVSFYNTASTPSCGTSIVYQTMIPANSTSGAGAVEDFATGLNFGTGIGICVATGIAATGNVAATAYVVNLGYK